MSTTAPAARLNLRNTYPAAVPSYILKAPEAVLRVENPHV